MHGRLFGRLIHDKRVGVGANHAVAQVDDARGILFRKFGVVGDHDHEAVLGHVLEQVHDLHGRVRIERAGRLVGQDDVRVVDQCAGDRHALHLAAGQLVRLFIDVFAESDLLQRLARTFATVGLADAGNRQREFDVRQNRLMRNQIVALEHEADGVVAVRIPIAILVLARRDAVDHQIAVVIPVEAADDVEQGGLAGTRGTQNRDEFAVA